MCRFARAGSVVLALHDASDVFLEVGKMSKYSGAEALASFSFILFVISWVLLRLIYYPFWILWSTRLLHFFKKKIFFIPNFYYTNNDLIIAVMKLFKHWIKRNMLKRGPCITMSSTPFFSAYLFFMFTGGSLCIACLSNKFKIEANLVMMFALVCFFFFF